VVATGSGTVREVTVHAADQVRRGQILVLIE
jgi:biotin carboxyl carrier protein